MSDIAHTPALEPNEPEAPESTTPAEFDIYQDADGRQVAVAECSAGAVSFTYLEDPTSELFHLALGGFLSEFERVI